MCGRVQIEITDEMRQEMKKIFSELDKKYGAYDNYSGDSFPQSSIPAIISQEGVKDLIPTQWGLLPFWAKDKDISKRMYNARAETIHEKASFKHAYKQRRAIIPVSVFYEFSKDKTPYLFKSTDPCKPLYLGALWEYNQQFDITSSTIITTEPNEQVKPIHNRNPVIIQDHEIELWLDHTIKDMDVLHEILQPKEKIFEVIKVA
jgi:putative SOS response-associated peptidase YedK